jgi:hypothetical protein
VTPAPDNVPDDIASSAEAMVAHLKLLIARLKRDKYVVMDNTSSHKTVLIRDWFAKRPRWHVH